MKNTKINPIKREGNEKHCYKTILVSINNKVVWQLVWLFTFTFDNNYTNITIKGYWKQDINNEFHANYPSETYKETPTKERIDDSFDCTALYWGILWFLTVRQ